MKRLIISVLMLMAATLIFSQANETREDESPAQEIVKQGNDNSVVG